MDLSQFRAKLSAGRVVGIVALVAGLVWTGAWICPSISSVFHGTVTFDWLRLLFDVATLPLLLFPGVLSAYFGFRLVREVTKDRITKAFGWFVFMCASACAAELLVVVAPATQPGTRDDIVFAAIECTAILAGVWIYLLVCRAIVRREGITVDGFDGLMQPGAIFLLALFLWFPLSELLERIYKFKVLDASKGVEWTALGGLGTMLFAFFVARVFYRGLMKLCGNDLSGGRRPFRLGRESNLASGPER